MYPTQIPYGIQFVPGVPDEKRTGASAAYAARSSISLYPVTMKPAVSRIYRPPGNLDQYVQEVLPGLQRLYGSPATEEYRRNGEHLLRNGLMNPAVNAYAIMEDSAALALLTTTRNKDLGRVTFVHVTGPYRGQGFESVLLDAALEDLQAAPTEGIFSECVAFCPLDLEGVFKKHGFWRTDRTIMRAPVQTVAREAAGTEAFSRANMSELAALIARVYERHPDRMLHPEVGGEAAAREFLAEAFAGVYGATFPEYFRCVREESHTVGAIIGCHTAADVGFVLHVFVAPEHQNRGIGSRLLRDLTGRFHRRGLHSVALGVTAASPARKLYERLGFSNVYPLTSWTWWRNSGSDRIQVRQV